MAPCLAITDVDCDAFVEAVDEFLTHHGHLLDTPPES